VGTSISVLTQEEIEQRGFLSLTEIMRTQPSVAATNNGGAGKATSLRIRGEEGYRTQVLLDGIDISDSSSPQVSPRMEHLLAAGIERVEILRGPQGLGYGADAGGVVNIRSLDPGEGLGGSFSAESGSLGTRQLAASVGGSAGDVSGMLFLADTTTDGINARTLDAAPDDRDGYDNRTAHGKMRWSLSERAALEFVLRSVSGDNDFDGCFTTGFLPSNRCRDRFEQDSWRVALNLDGGQLSHQLSLTSNTTEREFYAEEQPFFRADGEVRRGSYIGNWRALDTLSLSFGLELENEAIDDGSFDRDRDQLGAYVEGQWTLPGSTVLAAGVRRDDNDDFGSFDSYRISASRSVPAAVGELKFKASLGSGFRAPSLYEVSYNRGPFALPPASEINLDAETSHGYDLGVIWARDGGDFLEVTWFDQRVDELITFDLVGFSGYVQNPGESLSRGVEVAGRWQPLRQLTLSGNFTWNDTESAEGTQRPFRPQHLANLSLAYAMLEDRLQLGAGLRGSADAVDTGGTAIDDYVLLDFSARYNLGGGLEVYARIENALDENYREIPTYNTAGRTAFTGIRYVY
jgi:vitamin B12 transporter